MRTEARREPWKDSRGAQPYYEGLNDPKGGGPMYICTIAAASVETDGPIQDKINACERHWEASSTLSGTRGLSGLPRVRTSREAIRATPSSTHPRCARISWKHGPTLATTHIGWIVSSDSA
eukprot:5023750-Pyramimonas_sp.AAC.1